MTGFFFVSSCDYLYFSVAILFLSFHFITFFSLKISVIIDKNTRNLLQIMIHGNSYRWPEGLCKAGSSPKLGGFQGVFTGKKLIKRKLLTCFYNLMSFWDNKQGVVCDCMPCVLLAFAQFSNNKRESSNYDGRWYYLLFNCDNVTSQWFWG